MLSRPYSSQTNVVSLLLLVLVIGGASCAFIFACFSIVSIRENHDKKNKLDSHDIPQKVGMLFWLVFCVVVFTRFAILTSTAMLITDELAKT